MKTHLAKTLFVEAAHHNPRGGEAQQRLHGHSYRVDLLAGGEVSPEVGWLVDYGELKRLMTPPCDLLDHACLNELPGLEEDTTLPALHRWIEAQMAPRPDWMEGVRVSIVGDLCFNPVRLPADPSQGLHERILFTFESAQSLPQLPDGHPCRRIHGHSYRLEVAAKDLVPLEDALREIYDILDHRLLNHIPGLGCATCEYISRWVWKQIEQRGLGPTQIVIQETLTARCLYEGE